MANLQASEGLTRKLAINLFLLLFSVYVLSSSGNSVDVADDGIIRYAVSQRILEHGSIDLPADIGERWGYAGADGRYYAKHGLGQSLLAIPFLVAGNWLGNPKFCVSLLGPLLAASTCVLLFYFGLRLGYGCESSLKLSLLGGLGTQLWPESKSPFDHTVEGFFSLLFCSMVLKSWQEGSKRPLLAAGLSLGLASLTRLTATFWVLPLAMFWALFPNIRLGRVAGFVRNTLVFSAGFAPFLIANLWYNTIRFGSMFEAGYRLRGDESPLNIFGNPLWIGFLGELLGPSKGLLLYSPVLILTPFALQKFYRENREFAIFLIVSSIFYLSFFARFVAWHGDISWGPRYLTFLIPLWIAVIGNWKSVGSRGPSLLRRTIVILAFLVQLAAVSVDMNVHYFRLLREGVIKDVDTYHFPNEMYFQWRNSPLKDRVDEISQIIRGSRQVESSIENQSKKPWSVHPRLDFWWAYNLAQGMNGFAVLCLILPFVGEIVLSSLRICKFLGTGKL